MNDYSNIRVLVVDDEFAIRDRPVRLLEDYGFATKMCGSTEEAWDLMVENSFDVCGVDLCLPGLSGEDLIMLANKRFPDQRYSIHTGSISYNLSNELREIGMRPEHVFHKPVRVFTLLVKCIKELADNPNTQQAVA